MCFVESTIRGTSLASLRGSPNIPITVDVAAPDQTHSSDLIFSANAALEKLNQDVSGDIRFTFNPIGRDHLCQQNYDP